MSHRLTPEEWEKAGVSDAIHTSWWAPFIRWFPPTSHLQEIGCGGGNTALMLAQSSMRYRFTLVDFSAPMLSYAHHRFSELIQKQGVAIEAGFYRHDVLEPFPEDLPVADISYSIGLLEHFQDGEIVQVLKNQSKKARTVMAAVPNADCRAYLNWKKGLEDAGQWSYGFEDPKTFKQMRELFDAAGIDVVTHASIGDTFIDRDTDQRYLLAVLGNVRY